MFIAPAVQVDGQQPRLHHALPERHGCYVSGAAAFLPSLAFLITPFLKSSITQCQAQNSVLKTCNGMLVSSACDKRCVYFIECHVNLHLHSLESLESLGGRRGVQTLLWAADPCLQLVMCHVSVQASICTAC